MFGYMFQYGSLACTSSMQLPISDGAFPQVLDSFLAVENVAGLFVSFVNLICITFKVGFLSMLWPSMYIMRNPSLHIVAMPEIFCHFNGFQV